MTNNADEIARLREIWTRNRRERGEASAFLDGRGRLGEVSWPTPEPEDLERADSFVPPPENDEDRYWAAIACAIERTGWPRRGFAP